MRSIKPLQPTLPQFRPYRLIVVAEKQTVYKNFPTPLINRLEKHFLTINTILDEKQQNLARKLEDWAQEFASQEKSTIYQRSLFNKYSQYFTACIYVSFKSLPVLRNVSIIIKNSNARNVFYKHY